MSGKWRYVFWGLFWGIAFSIAYTQSPLYTSNQNQYFLHGLARANFGLINEDWLSSTLDPTPAFSLFVELTFRFLHPIFFYIFYAILLGLYLLSVLMIVESSRIKQASNSHNWIFLSIILVIHSAGWRFGLSRILGPDWGYILEDGFAGQRLLGPVLQPSTFGVLLLLSIVFFLRKHPFTAIFFAGLAATIHPTYLFGAACLVFVYMFETFRDKKGADFLQRIRKPIFMGLFGFLVVAPILVLSYKNFGITPLETTAQAQNILVNFRIPHHAIVKEWFGLTSIIKLSLLFIALFLIRQTKLFLLLLIPSIFSLIMTMIQILTGSDFLALLFPWRVSVLLIPLSVGIIIDRTLSKVFELHFLNLQKTKYAFLSISFFMVLMAVIVGSIRLGLDFRRQLIEPERPLYAWVSDNRDSGQIYLTPIKMQDFRLATGAPVFIDFKSIPYQDEDVLEWYRRVNLVMDFYNFPTCRKIKKLSDEENITQVILPSQNHLDNCGVLVLEYADDGYQLLSVSP